MRPLRLRKVLRLHRDWRRCRSCVHQTKSPSPTWTRDRKNRVQSPSTKAAAAYRRLCQSQSPGRQARASSALRPRLPCVSANHSPDSEGRTWGRGRALTRTPGPNPETGAGPDVGRRGRRARGGARTRDGGMQGPECESRGYAAEKGWPQREEVVMEPREAGSGRKGAGPQERGGELRG